MSEQGFINQQQIQQAIQAKAAANAMRTDELTRLREENAVLKRENFELQEWKETEQQACIKIAAACLSTGILPKSIDGGVEAVKFLCDHITTLTTRAERAEALLRDIQATELSEHYGNCRDALAMLKIKVDDFLD